MLEFQSTPLYEGRLVAGCWVREPNLFQSTPLYEGRLINKATVAGLYDVFQSTPLYEGRPSMLLVPSRTSFVSIHAPVRGATKNLADLQAFLSVSIHAPVRGATGQTPIYLCPMHLFQSTPLYEGRLPT